MTAKHQPKIDNEKSQKHLRNASLVATAFQEQQSTLPAVISRANTAPRSLAAGNILQLQRNIGNRAVNQLLAQEPKVQRNTKLDEAEIDEESGDTLNVAIEVDQVPPEKFPPSLGFTYWPKKNNPLGLVQSNISFQTAQGGNGWTAQVVNSGAPAEPTYNSYAAPAGRHALGETQKKRPGLVIVGPGYITLTQNDHALVRQGEREHVSDMTRAFTLTLQAAYNASQALAGINYPGDGEDDAVLAAAQGFVGRLSAGFRNALLPVDLKQLNEKILNLYFMFVRQTKLRDDREWHSLKRKSRVMDNPYRIEVTLSPNRTDEIGQHPSDQLIDWAI